MLDVYKQLNSQFYSNNNVKHFFTKVPYPNHEEFSMHWHEHMELLFIKQGSMTIDFGSAEYTAKEGDLVIIPPGQLHRGVSGPQSAQYNVLQFDVDKFYINSAATETYLKPLNNHEVTFVPVTNDPQAIKAVTELLEAQGQHHLNPMRTFAKVYELLGILFDNCNTDKSHKRSTERFAKVFEYINTHYTEKLTTKQLCEKFGYAEAYFCRNFKSITGLTVTKYIQEIRIEQVFKLMKETKMDIGSIAISCGFTDFSYFCYIFKRKYNLTPGEYRKFVVDEQSVGTN